MSLHHRAKSLIRVGVVSVVGLVVSSGCSDSSGQNDECDVPALFAQRCGSVACHGGPDNTLNLVDPGVEDRVANAQGTQCNGILADPSDPEGSLLYEKVAQTTPSCGARMPLGGQPLSDAEIMCIRDWISGLLPPQPDPVDAGPDCPECVCEPSVVESCYSGPAGTVGNGSCQAGSRQCAADGLSWGDCMGEILPTGENCFTDNVDENCDGQTPPCGPLWSMGFGLDATSQSLRSVAIDSASNVIVVGDFEGTINFGGEPLTATGIKSDIVLAKYDQYGNHVWSQRFGDSSNQYATQVTVDESDNIIIIGRAFGTIDFGGTVLDGKGTEDIFVAKFDSAGNHVWSRIFGGLDGDRAERVIADHNGDVLVTGTFRNVVDFGSGPFTTRGVRDGFLLKLSSSTGSHVFSLQIGGPGDDDYGYGVGVDAQNNIFITGRFENTMDLGNTTLSSMGGTDIYVAKLDSFGNYQWAKGFGGLTGDAAYDLAMDPQNGEFAITGFVTEAVDFGGGPLMSAGAEDIFLARFDNDGNHLFSAVYGDAMNQFESTYGDNIWTALTMDASGNMYIGGPLSYGANFGGPTLMAAGKLDAYFVKLAPNGTYLAGNRYGGSGTEIALDIAVTPDGQHIALAGRLFSSSVNFGASGTVKGHVTNGGSDGFVVQLAP